MCRQQRLYYSDLSDRQYSILQELKAELDQESMTGEKEQSSPTANLNSKSKSPEKRNKKIDILAEQVGSLFIYPCNEVVVSCHHLILLAGCLLFECYSNDTVGVM